MSLSPSIPEPPNPAKRPERGKTIEPEDVEVGTEDQESSDEKRGRRALRRPAGNTGRAGSDVGTGLSA